MSEIETFESHPSITVGNSPSHKRRLAGEPSRAKRREALVAMRAIVRLRLDFGGKTKMSGSGKDRLAALVIDQHTAFEQALAGSRKRYPMREFRSFAALIRLCLARQCQRLSMIDGSFQGWMSGFLRDS